MQADLKAFSAHGVYGCSVITVVTAQNTRAVTAVHPIPPDVIAAQIDAVLSDIRIDVIKIGMLGNVDTIEAVAEAIAGYRGPIVLDPVMIAKSGDALLEDSAVAALRARLMPRATLLTPNIPEAERLLSDADLGCACGMPARAEALRAMGPRAVLLKGGHAEGRHCIDHLVTQDNHLSLKSERIDTANTHGTGCSYAAAIAAQVARGHPLDCAVRAAHGWLHSAIRAADGLDVGSGHGPVHHFHGLWK